MLSSDGNDGSRASFKVKQLNDVSGGFRWTVNVLGSLAMGRNLLVYFYTTNMRFRKNYMRLVQPCCVFHNVKPAICFHLHMKYAAHSDSIMVY